MALLLAISRKVPQSIERTRAGDFLLKGLRGFDLKGKTIGIIGVGHIGSHVVKMARAFDMNVLGYNRTADQKLAKRLGFTYTSLDVLLKKSDILSLHLPLTEKTYHFLNQKAFAKMKKGVIIINTARGGLIDTYALVRALDTGVVAAAGLDVLEGECHIKEERQLISPVFAQKCDLKTILADHILLRRKNVFITPHNAFNSQEALARIIDTSVENIVAYLRGKKKNVVS
jgi:D-lactate dehydrogenase